MSVIFTCDNCKDTFPQAIEEEKFLDDNGILHTFDLCAPCKNKLIEESNKTNIKFFSKLIKQ